MENEIEGLDSQTQEAEVPPEEDKPAEYGLPEDKPEVEPKDDQETDAEELKRKNQELYEQLKKAKGFERDRKTGKWVKKEPQKEKEVNLSPDITRVELFSLVKAGVPDEDVQECITYARSHKMDITTALKTPQLKAILKTNAEYRKTEEAANVSPSGRSTPKLSDEELLKKASRGEMPDDPTLIAEARLRQRGAKI